MRHYYAVIDQENQNYGIALSIGSRGFITDDYISDQRLIFYFGCVLGVLVMTIGMAFVLAKCRQRRFEKRLATMR